MRKLLISNNQVLFSDEAMICLFIIHICIVLFFPHQQSRPPTWMSVRAKTAPRSPDQDVAAIALTRAAGPAVFKRSAGVPRGSRFLVEKKHVLERGVRIPGGAGCGQVHSKPLEATSTLQSRASGLQSAMQGIPSGPERLLRVKTKTNSMPSTSKKQPECSLAHRPPKGDPKRGIRKTVSV